MYSVHDFSCQAKCSLGPCLSNVNYIFHCLAETRIHDFRAKADLTSQRSCSESDGIVTNMSAVPKYSL